MNALQIIKFYHKEHKGVSQRAQLSLCDQCVTIASFYIKCLLDCFVPRNDGTCSTSLRGTKQSRKSVFYYGFSISKKNLYFALKNLLKALPLVILFGCGEPLMDYETNVTMPVVESYLQQGSNTMTVNIYSMEEFLKDEYKLQKPISKLKVFVNQIELKETSSGSYSLTLDNDSLREGQTYTLQFMHNGKNIEATTTIPSPIRSLAVEPESVKISSASFWNISDETQVIVSWDDPDNSFYQIYIVSPNNPDMPSMGVFRNRMMQPFQGNTYRLSTRELRSTGTHAIYVYRVGKDYAELYERVSASDLANPVSYIRNAFGIFTSLSVARINVRVTEN